MKTDKRDSELFAEVQKEDRASFNRLFMLYYQPLCRYAFTITKSEAESEELVSDVFFIFWTKAKKIAIESSVRVYLYACVKHAALARLKAIEPAGAQVGTCALIDVPHPSADAQAGLEYMDLERRFNKAIAQLPERCREVFILNRLDNLRYKEVAKILGISEKTVENHLVKAVALMRKAMEPQQLPIL